jgi:hypothetical protein
VKFLNLESPDNSLIFDSVIPLHPVRTCEYVEILIVNLLFLFSLHCVSFLIIGEEQSDSDVQILSPGPKNPSYQMRLHQSNQYEHFAKQQ